MRFLALQGDIFSSSHSVMHIQQSGGGITEIAHSGIQLPTVVGTGGGSRRKRSISAAAFAPLGCW